MKKFTTLTSRLMGLGSILAAWVAGSSMYATTCAGAISLSPASLPITSAPVVCGVTNDITGTTIPTCGSTSYRGGLEALYSLAPTSSGVYNISISGQTWTGIFVYQGCPGFAGTTCVGNVTSSASAKTLSVNLTAGFTYYILFDTWPSPASPCSGTGSTFSINAVGAAPANDLCSGSSPVFCGSTISGTTLGATGDGTTTCGTTPAASGVWYVTFGDGNIFTASTCGLTSLDTRINVYSGAGGCAALTCVGGNDNGTGTCGTGSSFTWSTTAGVPYFILVSSTTQGTFGMSLTCTPPPPGDNCGSALPISLGGSVSGNTSFYTPDASAPTCSGFSVGTGGGVWYSFVGTGVLVTASMCNAVTTYDSKLHVYSGSCSSPVCVVADDDACVTPGLASTVTFCAAEGVRYWILVNGFSSSQGPYQLNLDPATSASVSFSGLNANYCVTGAGSTLSGSPSGGTFSGPGMSGSSFNPAVAGVGTHTITYTVCGVSTSLTTTVADAPANDLCANAISITTGSYSGNTICAGIDAGLSFCGTTGGTSGGVWYTFTGDGNRWNIETCNMTSDYDTKLHVFSGSCGSLACVAGNDDMGSAACPVAGGTSFSGFRSQVNFCTSIGVQYYVLVHGFSTARGNFTIDVTSTPGPGAMTSVSTYACGYNVSCNGACDGSATAAGFGGSGSGYTYQWSNGQNTATATGLCAGTYTVTVTDGSGCQGTASVTLTEPAPVTVNAGPNVTVYFGYTPAFGCATLTATGIGGGCGPYSISWSTGESTASINVCPSTTTTYTVTVTDANGCTVSDDVKVCVVDVRCGPGLGKVEICHVTGSGTNTLCVAPSAVAAHLAHGDQLGSCSAVRTCDDGPSSGKVAATAEISMVAFPNPFETSTSIRFSVSQDEAVTVTVYNVLGEEVATLFNGEANAHMENTVTFTPRTAAGIFIVKMTTASGQTRVERVVMQ